MRFWLGLAVGLMAALPAGLLAAPPSDPVVLPQPLVITPPAMVIPDPPDVEYRELEDFEVRCLIRWMEAEVGKGWDALTVILYLDRSFAEFDGPCDAEVNA